jgi:hypothetical protein
MSSLSAIVHAEVRDSTRIVQTQEENIECEPSTETLDIADHHHDVPIVSPADRPTT